MRKSERLYVERHAHVKAIERLEVAHEVLNDLAVLVPAEDNIQRLIKIQRDMGYFADILRRRVR